MQHTPAILSPHRFARALLWARAMLTWLARFVFADARTPKRRHIARRYRYASLEALARLVRNLILIRAAGLSGVRRPPPRAPLDTARAGFRRRMRARHMIRAAGGARLRRALRHRDPAQRLARLLHALAHLDAYATPLIARAKRGLTRLRAITVTAPRAVALAAWPPRAIEPADSS